MLTPSESEAMPISIERQHSEPSSWVRMEQDGLYGAADCWFDLGKILDGRVAVKADVVIKTGWLLRGVCNVALPEISKST